MHEGNGDSIPSTTVPDRINCLWKRTDPGWGHTWKELRKKKKSQDSWARWPIL